MAVTIRGWAHRADDWAEISPGKFEWFAPNAIINKTVSLRLAHHRSPATTFAHAKLYQSDLGCAFEAVIPDCQNAYGLARMIRGGCDSISMCFRTISKRSNGTGTVIDRARLTEISIVPEGAYASARCWVVGDLRSRSALLTSRTELAITSHRTENEQLMVYGAAPQQADQIFSAFLTTKRHGTGRGWPSARSIVELHNGR